MKYEDLKIEDLRTLGFLELRTLSDAKYLKPDFSQAVFKELAVRNITGSSIEYGLQQLKRMLAECNTQLRTDFLKVVVDESISREETGSYRRSLIKPLYIAQKKLRSSMKGE